MRFVKSWLRRREELKALRFGTKVHKAHLKVLLEKEQLISHDVFEVIKFSLEQNIDFFKSLELLYSNGRYQACFILARSLMENVVNLRYVLQADSDRRAKNFILHPLASMAKRLENLKDDFSEKSDLIQFLKSLGKDIDRSGSVVDKWDGKTIRKMFEDLDWGDTIHGSWYLMLSNYGHSMYKGDRDLAKERPYNNMMKRMVTKDLVVLSLQALKDINDKYELQEGHLFISDYPKDGVDFIFSFSPKRIDEEQAKAKPPA